MFIYEVVKSISLCGRVFFSLEDDIFKGPRGGDKELYTFLQEKEEYDNFYGSLSEIEEAEEKIRKSMQEQIQKLKEEMPQDSE